MVGVLPRNRSETDLARAPMLMKLSQMRATITKTAMAIGPGLRRARGSFMRKNADPTVAPIGMNRKYGRETIPML
jgi:hypothetical protein